MRKWEEIENTSYQGLSGFVDEKMTKFNVPGIALALIDHDEVRYFVKGNVSDSSPGKVNIATVFHMDSNSKIITAYMVLLAVRDGRLSLDEPIKTYLPDLNLRSLYEREPGKIITLRHLLSHHAGLTHEAKVGNNFDAKPKFEAHMDSILYGEEYLVAKVGSQYRYSNIGIDIAGYILKEVYGIPFAELAEKMVFGPLGMTSSSFDPNETKGSSRAKGKIDGFSECPENYSLIPCGGWHASLNDVVKFMQHFMLEVKREDSFVHDMLDLQFAKSRQLEGYGLGIWKFMIGKSKHYGHHGRGFGFSTTIYWNFDSQVGTVVLTNKQGNNIDTEIAMHLMEQFVADHDEKMLHLDSLPRHTKQGIKNFKFGEYYSSYGKITVSAKGDDAILLEGAQPSGPFGWNYQSFDIKLHQVAGDLYCNDANTLCYRNVPMTEYGSPGLMRVNDGHWWFYNGHRTADNIDESVVGRYVQNSYGYLIDNTVEINEGNLYLNKIRCDYQNYRIYTTADGEIVNFTDPATYRNIPMVKCFDEMPQNYNPQGAKCVVVSDKASAHKYEKWAFSDGKSIMIDISSGVEPCPNKGFVFVGRPSVFSLFQDVSYVAASTFTFALTSLVLKRLVDCLPLSIKKTAKLFTLWPFSLLILSIMYDLKCKHDITLYVLMKCILPGVQNSLSVSNGNKYIFSLLLPFVYSLYFFHPLASIARVSTMTLGIRLMNIFSENLDSKSCSQYITQLLSKMCVSNSQRVNSGRLISSKSRLFRSKINGIGQGGDDAKLKLNEMGGGM